VHRTKQLVEAIPIIFDAIGEQEHISGIGFEDRQTLR
jgi:hypothetical protein